MPLKPTERETDRGLRYLEEKLSLYVAGPGQRRRNPALDVLTGRVPDARAQAAPAPPPAPSSVPAVDTPPARSHPATLVLPRPTAPRAAPAYRPTRASASPWLAPVAPAAHSRVRLVTPPAPTRSLQSFAPRAIALLLTAGAALGVGLAVRGVIASSTTPASVIVVAAPPVAEPTPVVVPQTLVVQPTVAPPPPTVAPTVAPKVAQTTPPPAPQSADQFRLLVDERFSSPKLDWPTDASGPAWLTDGTLRLEPRQASHFVALGVPGATDLGDVVVSGTFKKLDGPAGGGYGFIVRDETPALRDGVSQAGRFYVFEVGDRGELGVWLRDGDRWVDLLPWTASDVVKQAEATNELTVSAIGDHLSFMVNGIPVASLHDTVLHRGGIGMFVGGDGNSVGLERLAVRVPR